MRCVISRILAPIMNINDGFPSNIWERWSVLMKYLFAAQDVLKMVQNGYEDLGAEPSVAQKPYSRIQRRRISKLC